LIVIGGYDALTIKNIGYGIYSKRNIRTIIANINYHLATHICPVHHSCFFCINDYINEYQGYDLHYKYGVHKTTIIPCGYDVNYWRNFESIRQIDFMMVGFANDEISYKRKGYSLLMKIALTYKDKIFLAVGLNRKYHDRMPKNVQVFEKLSPLDLRCYYNRSKYYLQLSLNEAGPLTLREAILCGCIPIVSNVPSMADCVKPENILYKPNVSDLIKIVESGLKYDPEIELKVRQCTIEKRKQVIEKIIR
jgi:glycosyltransferase involved in cell wall biosynthesis